MPTDKERFEKLMADFGITFSTTNSYMQDLADNDPNALCIVEGSSDKVKGYSDFFTTWRFDSEGAFVGLEIWE